MRVPKLAVWIPGCVRSHLDQDSGQKMEGSKSVISFHTHLPGKHSSTWEEDPVDMRSAKSRKLDTPLLQAAFADHGQAFQVFFPPAIIKARERYLELPVASRLEAAAIDNACLLPVH
jgi:hypothetical protein